MSRLPVIVGFGGISPAGRSSAHHGFRRLVVDALPRGLADATLRSLGALMGREDAESTSGRAYILDHTLVRRIEPDHFDVDNVSWNRRMQWSPASADGIRFRTSAAQLPDPLPAGWRVVGGTGRELEIHVDTAAEILVPSPRVSEVQAAGQLPSGFDPRSLYPARSHPRGLQMTVYGASDAIQSLGFAWEELLAHVAPNEISVYAGSGMSQLDANANGGMMTSRLMGKRVTSKHCPFGFAEMPADFINAYILGTLGNTGTSMGACASFLYNLRQAVADLQSGRARVALVGNAEAPLTPEVIEGYAAMGALATDQGLRALDGLAPEAAPDYRRACRPFAENCGFTIAESAQFVVLLDAELALDMGANVYGAIGDVFVNADGYKKSIASPGVGNYLTMARAVALARAIAGEEAVRRRSFVHAHGTGTPQNRVTESHILNETARIFGIEHWPVAAVKSYLGHSIGAAAGDQLIMTLGTWAHGLIPGITTIDEPAADVHRSRLRIDNRHFACDARDFDVAIINAKGFGGNNASCAVLAPHLAMKMLERCFGRDALRRHAGRNEKVREAAEEYDRRATAGEARPIYRFDHDVLGPESLRIDAQGIGAPGYALPIELDVASPYPEMS